MDLKLITRCIAMSDSAASFDVKVIYNRHNDGIINVIVNGAGDHSEDEGEFNKRDKDQEELEEIRKQVVAICKERAAVIFKK